jgi:hypothetical protein
LGNAVVARSLSAASLKLLLLVGKIMDSLTAFGLFAVSAMLVCYALEQRSPWFILAFAASCALGSAYGFLQGAWPFGVVEAIWSLVALRRWRFARRA